MSLPNLSQPEYQPQPIDPSDGLQGLNSMVHSFLGLVQPNAFPEFLPDLMKYPDEFQNSDRMKEVLLYEAGFLVCSIIGLLFIIFVPLVGLCFCCCRCCGNCGGRMYQKQTKHTSCRRRALFASVLVISTILLAGDICAFVSNNRISQTVDESFGTFNSTVDNLRIFLHSIPQEVDFIINTSSVPIGQANDSLLDIGNILGKKIVTHIGGRALKALDTFKQFLTVTDTVQRELQKVNESEKNLKELQKRLDHNLTSLRNEINETLNKCGEACKDVSVSSLEPGINFSMVLEVNQLVHLIDNVTHLDPNATIVKAEKVLDEIPDKVSNQTHDVVSDAQTQLGKVKQQIATIHSNFSMLDTLQNVSELLGDVSKTASTYEPHIITYDGYRWRVGVCLCCLVLLIIVLNTIGLLCGALGLNPQATPTKRGCLSNAGGDFFMASVGFSFIFAWFLMLVVLLTFLLGGNAYTLVCRPWASGKLFQFLDTPGLFPNFNLTQLLGLKTSDVTISSLYKACSKNEPLWNSLHLGEVISLDEILNISKYTGDIDSTLNKMEVNVSTTELLSEEQKSFLMDLGMKDGPLHLDFDKALKQINQNVTQQNLSDLATQLEKLAKETKNSTSGISDDLQRLASELRELQLWTEFNFLPEIQVLNSSIWLLKASVAEIQDLANATLSEVKYAETFMKERAEEIVKNESLAFVHSVLGFFGLYLDWAKSIITGEMARCGPAAWTVNSVNTVVCSYFVDSLNAFWFSLGWCTIFLLPSIILAVRLAKFYRKMHMDDIYEGSFETVELSRPPSMFKFPRAELRK